MLHGPHPILRKFNSRCRANTVCFPPIVPHSRRQPNNRRRHKYLFCLLSWFYQCNPFRQRLAYVFSSKQDDCFSFDDFVDLASVSLAFIFLSTNGFFFFFFSPTARSCYVFQLVMCPFFLSDFFFFTVFLLSQGFLREGPTQRPRIFCI